jgi:hypothetical protein
MTRISKKGTGLVEAVRLKYGPRGKKYGSGVNEGKGDWAQQASQQEEELCDNIDMKYKMIETFKTIWPLFEGHLKTGDVSKLLHASAPYAVMTLISEMIGADKSRERIDAAKTVSYMAGYQPVQRNLNIEGNIDRMTDDQVTGLLKAAFHGMTVEERKTIQAALEQKQLAPPKEDKV